MKNLNDLEIALEYAWKDRNTLLAAVTHVSYGNSTGEAHNERLEFLGDAVLDLIVASHLMDSRPNDREGAMSIRRAEMVKTETMAAHSYRLGLDKIIRVRSEDLRKVNRVMANALEAVIGAAFHDGGISAAHRVARASGVIPW